jgi:hypothetical protein
MAQFYSANAESVYSCHPGRTIAGQIHWPCIVFVHTQSFRGAQRLYFTV